WNQIHDLDPHLFLFRLAYLAADQKLQNETKALVAELFRVVPEGLSALTDQFAWQFLSDGMTALYQGKVGHFGTCVVEGNDDRRQFLKTCRDLRNAFPDSKYDQYLQSLIESLEREAAASLPAFLNKKPGERSQAEWIQYWIYQLRDLAAGQWSDPGSPEIF